ncbi:Eukaryotic/viral aspartic protease [Phytophthora megakarya]|uniref:Eukaryotic/viral aspartic protease n=1 Tax=Phytophthora megakarya TaxID=4795 RepID=A0A225VG71_9STRA|nr:Eukaryotic/viral aspartic protease [Phytophthora megakarya]
MLDTSSWVRPFAPKAAEQAVWVELVEELSYPVNSTRTNQVAEDKFTLTHSQQSSPTGPRRKQALRCSDGNGNSRLCLEAMMLVLDDNRWFDLPEKDEHSVGKDAEEDLFGSAEQSSYFHDSHRVTPRSESHKARVAREAEQAELTANTRPGAERNSLRCQAPADDVGNPFYHDDDEIDSTTELVVHSR